MFIDILYQNEFYVLIVIIKIDKLGSLNRRNVADI